jgi:hypothetical protein
LDKKSTLHRIYILYSGTWTYEKACSITLHELIKFKQQQMLPKIINLPFFSWNSIKFSTEIIAHYCVLDHSPFSDQMLRKLSTLIFHSRH